MNIIKSKRQIGLFFFIDFKKAFDLVDPQLLLFKLKYYGFSANAIELIADYFKNRNQIVKFDNILSKLREIVLSVPQGSVLGPLFFLIFVNDLPECLLPLTCKMFADDTTLYDTSNNLNALIQTFNIKIKPLTLWCNYNKLDINWSKTFTMFITNKRVEIPQEIIILGNKISVVKSFKLLGLTIDNKLNFINYVSQLRITVNKKLFN